MDIVVDGRFAFIEKEPGVVLEVMIDDLPMYLDTVDEPIAVLIAGRDEERTIRRDPAYLLGYLHGRSAKVGFLDRRVFVEDIVVPAHKRGERLPDAIHSEGQKLLQSLRMQPEDTPIRGLLRHEIDPEEARLALRNNRESGDIRRGQGRGNQAGQPVQPQP